MGRFCLGLVIAALLLPIGAEAQTLGVEKYKIGIILPLSGNSSSIGNALKQAAELAWAKLPPAEQAAVKLIFEDDELSPAKSVSAYQKLINMDNVRAIIVFGSGSGNAVAPLAEARATILMALVASDRRVTAGRRFVFSHWFPLETQAAAIAAEVKRRGYKKIAMVSGEQEGINAIDNAFLEAVRAYQLEDRIVLKFKTAADTFDFNTIIARLRAAEVDAVYTVLLPGPSVFTKQARAAGVRAEFFGVQTFENEQELLASSGAMIGSWYVNTEDPTGEFVQSYRNRFGCYPAFVAPNAFDAVSLLAAGAVRHSGDNLRIAEHLALLKDFHGAAGVYSATGDHRFTLPVAVKVVGPDGFHRAAKSGLNGG